MTHHCWTLRPGWLKSNKYSPSKKDSWAFYACISSRITTVIHVVGTIKWIITDLMSHSQFHCIDLLILRHAWLSLWDKHITTGRINQVTIVVLPPFENKINTLRDNGALGWDTLCSPMAKHALTTKITSPRSRSQEWWKWFSINIQMVERFKTVSFPFGIPFCQLDGHTKRVCHLDLNQQKFYFHCQQFSSQKKKSVLLGPKSYKCRVCKCTLGKKNPMCVQRDVGTLTQSRNVSIWEKVRGVWDSSPVNVKTLKNQWKISLRDLKSFFGRSRVDVGTQFFPLSRYFSLWEKARAFGGR